LGFFPVLRSYLGYYPNSVTSIGAGTFASCDNLTSINIEENNPAYVLENGVLFNKTKTNLIQYPAGRPDANYTIPNSVTSIGYAAFDHCFNLASVVIGRSVTRFGDWTFSGYYSLRSVTCLNPKPPKIWTPNIFGGINLSKATLYVPAASIESYKTASIWGISE
jgi:hypothetical protein